MLTRDTNKPMVSQVAMIESKFEKQDSHFLGKKVHLPAAIFNKSPSRFMPGTFQSPNRMGTPSRLQGKVTSPIRFRKHQPTNRLNNYFSQPSPMLGSNQNQIRSKGQQYLTSSGQNCANKTHGIKPGTFVVQTDQGQDVYCEKCAILLASKGFKVQRMQKSTYAPTTHAPHLSKLQYLCELDNPERRSSLMTFLNELQKINTQLTQKKNEIQSVLKSNNSYFKEQQLNIEQYFTQIKDMIDNQKIQLLQEVKLLQKETDRIPDAQLKKIMTCLNDCQTMKEDIYESIQIIRQVDDEAFDKVITAYVQKGRQIKSMDFSVNSIVDLPKIVGQDVNQLSRKIVGMLNFRIENNQKESQIQQYEVNPLHDRQSSVYFSFDNPSKQPMINSTQPTVTSGHSDTRHLEADPKESISLKLNSNLNYEYGQF